MFQLPVCWSKCSLKIEVYLIQTNPFFLMINLSVLSGWWEPLVSVEYCSCNSWSLVWKGHVSVASLLVKMFTENWSIYDPDKSILFTGQFECHTGMMRTSCFSGMLFIWQLKFGVNKARFSGQFSGQNIHWKLKYIWSRQIHSCHWSTWVSYWEDEELNYGWKYSFLVKPRPPRSFRRGNSPGGWNLTQ